MCSARLLLIGAVCARTLLFELASSWTIFLSWELTTARFSLELPIVLDQTSMTFFLSVRLIARAILTFSQSYMSQEKFYIRFHLLVLGFVGSIYLLILSPGLTSLLIGWDGLGVTSYLLVIYFRRDKSFNAGMLTALTNRVGDCLILIALSLWAIEGSWAIFLWDRNQCSKILVIPIFLFVLAATTKRAQIPFCAWLPAAMAAPTPVSSLVHSSTLVTAGVYLLIRFNLLLESSGLLFYLLWVGRATIILAGTAALFETDIKKIVALSTLRQLGLIFSALGLGAPQVTFFHLLTHAFFKALLFITIGNIIHIRKDFQDLRRVGINSLSQAPTLGFRLVANFSLMGLPFLAGFYSKDLILELALCRDINFLSLNTLFLATLLTSLYTIRLLVLMLWDWNSRAPFAWERDNDLKIFSSMRILWPLAIIGGSLLSWALLSSSSLPILSPLSKFLTPSVIAAGAARGLFWQAPYFKIVSGPLRAWGWGRIWGLPFNSSRGVLLYGLGRGLKGRTLLDLKWTPCLANGPTSPLALFVPRESLRSLNLRQGFFMLVLLSLWLILIYLCISNMSPRKSNFLVRDTLTHY